MRTFTPFNPVLFVLLCVSCDGPAIDRSQSLVGATSLPSAQQLSSEIIQIHPGSSVWDPDAPRLFYELKPDNSLTVTLSHSGPAADFHEVIDGKETFQLSRDVAANTRHLLWRVRPQELNGVEWLTRPSGCPPPPTDVSSDYSVAFIAEGPKPGIEDDRVGIFELLPARYCREKSAAEARRVIQNVLHILPQSNVAAEYDSRVAARDRPDASL